MSTTPQQYINWTSALTEKLLACMITTGCHFNNRKWKDCAESFYTAEYKRVCGTMGWRDFNIGNLSAMENGDLEPVEIKMKQIIEEQDAVKMDKDEDRARQARLQNLESCVISGSANSVLKITKKSKSSTSSSKDVQAVVSNEEVRCGTFHKYFSCLKNFSFRRRTASFSSIRSSNLPFRNGKILSLRSSSRNLKKRKRFLKKTSNPACFGITVERNPWT